MHRNLGRLAGRATQEAEDDYGVLLDLEPEQGEGLAIHRGRHRKNLLDVQRPVRREGQHDAEAEANISDGIDQERLRCRPAGLGPLGPMRDQQV